MIQKSSKNYADIQGKIAQMMGYDRQGTSQAQAQIQQTTQNALNTLQGVENPAKQAIFAQGAQAMGSAQQQAMNSGLGNTSFGLASQLVAQGQAQNAMASLHAQLGQTEAGYQFQGGMASAQAGMQGLGLENQFMGGALRDLADYRFSGGFAPQTGQFSQQSSYGQEANPFFGGGGSGGAGGGGIGDVSSGGGNGNPYSFGTYALQGGDPNSDSMNAALGNSPRGSAVAVPGIASDPLSQLTAPGFWGP